MLLSWCKNYMSYIHFDAKWKIIIRAFRRQINVWPQFTIIQTLNHSILRIIASWMKNCRWFSRLNFHESFAIFYLQIFIKLFVTKFWRCIHNIGTIWKYIIFLKIFNYTQYIMCINSYACYLYICYFIFRTYDINNFHFNYKIKVKLNMYFKFLLPFGLLGTRPCVSIVIDGVFKMLSSNDFKRKKL